MRKSTHLSFQTPKLCSELENPHDGGLRPVSKWLNSFIIRFLGSIAIISLESKVLHFYLLHHLVKIENNDYNYERADYCIL